MANPRGTPANLKPWRPGQSGNPAGRSRRVRLRDAQARAQVREILDGPDGSGQGINLVLRDWVERALLGDYRAIRDLLDAVEGPVQYS
jgi:hypothetical protein